MLLIPAMVSFFQNIVRVFSKMRVFFGSLSFFPLEFFWPVHKKQAWIHLFYLIRVGFIRAEMMSTENFGKIRAMSTQIY